jgi:hypothetical protein
MGNGQTFTDKYPIPATKNVSIPYKKVSDIASIPEEVEELNLEGNLLKPCEEFECVVQQVSFQ